MDSDAEQALFEVESSSLVKELSAARTDMSTDDVRQGMGGGTERTGLGAGGLGAGIRDKGGGGGGRDGGDKPEGDLGGKEGLLADKLTSASS